MTNFGAHHLDIAQWGLGRDESGPCHDRGHRPIPEGRLVRGPRDTATIVYTYDDGIKVICEQGAARPARTSCSRGPRGRSPSPEGKIESTPAEILKTPLESGDVHLYVSKNHHKNWLDCIKSRALPICDVAIGHRSATVCHLGNIAIRTGRKITWDPKAQTIVGDTEAAEMLSPPLPSPLEPPRGDRRSSRRPRGSDHQRILRNPETWIRG